MTGQWRPPEFYLHGAGVDVPIRVAAWLHARLQLDNVRANLRGADAEVDSVLVAITEAAQRWRISVNGNREPLKPEMQEQSWLSTTGAATRLGVTDSAVRMAIRQGRLPADQVDGRWRIAREDVEHYRAARRAA